MRRSFHGLGGPFYIQMPMATAAASHFSIGLHQPYRESWKIPD